MKKIFILTCLIGMIFSSSSYALSIMVAQGWDPYRYNSSNMDNMTAALQIASEGNIAVGSLDNYSQMLSYDGLWIDVSVPYTTFSSTAITNITNYVATGRRVVMIGEALEGWTARNIQMLAIVGGAYVGTFTGDGWDNKVYPKIYDHQITCDTSSLSLFDGGIASGGTQLYDINCATLWGDSLNVLTVLDVMVFSDGHWNYASNARFANNVAEWLAGKGGGAVPEPATVSLLGMGIITIVGFANRRKF